MAYIYDLTDTWNAGGTTFNAIKMNVTDSASAAASKLVTLQTNGTEHFSVTKAGVGYFSGNVGIGTTSLGAKLTVVGTTKIGEGAASNTSKLMVNTLSGTAAGIQLFQDGNESWIIQNPASTTALTFANSGTERMRINSSGNVGIGTTIPAAKLEVARTDAAEGIRVTVGQGAYSGTVALFGVTGQSNGYYITKDSSNNIQHIWDGTAGSERMRIDSSGNVGIGTTSPGAKLEVYGGSIKFGNASGNALLTADGSATYMGSLSNHPLVFNTNNTERARIDSSGNLLVGTTSAIDSASGTTDGFTIYSSGRFDASRSSNSTLNLRRRTTDGAISLFYRDTANVGSISVTTTATAYNTSSDYRLKDIDGPITNSGSYIDALKPVQGSWKLDGSRFIGLLAHEVQEVSETLIATGEKDGEEMQTMDYSAPEIIANLIAEIQSLRKRVAQLEGN